MGPGFPSHTVAYYPGLDSVKRLEPRVEKSFPNESLSQEFSEEELLQDDEELWDDEEEVCHVTSVDLPNETKCTYTYLPNYLPNETAPNETGGKREGSP